jgi:hypothetical protein
MRDIQDLRHALHDQSTAGAGHINLAAIRSRGRQIRRRRHAVAGTAILAAFGLIAPIVPNFFDGASNSGQVAAISPAATPSFLGGVAETGVVFHTPNHRYDVVLGFVGPQDQPAFTVAFRDAATSVVTPWDMVILQRGSDGGFAGKHLNDRAHQFHSSQLLLEPGRLLDVGVFSGPAQRITVTSEGRTSDATVHTNSETGWTLFWVVRDAKPLPPEAYTTERGYTGPESITVTAYSADGNALGTATSSGASRPDLSRIGGAVTNPRDNAPEDVDPTPSVSATSEPN